MTDLGPLREFLSNNLNKALKESQISAIMTEQRFVIPLRHLTSTPVFALGAPFDPFSAETPYLSFAFFTDYSLAALRRFVEFGRAFSAEQRTRLTITILLSQPSFYVETLLKESKLPHKVVKLQLPFFIYDDSLTLAQMPAYTAESARGGDSGANFQVLEALKTIYYHFGIFSEIFFKGVNSYKIAARLYEQTYCEVRIEQQQYPEESMFDKLILLDRSADVLSCVLTPITYHALLYETFYTSFDSIYLDSKKMPVPKQQTSIWGSQQYIDCADAQYTQKYAIYEFILDAKKDPVYDKIRYLPLDKLSQAMQEISLSIKAFYASANQSLAGLPLNEVKYHANKIYFYRLLEDKLAQHLKIVNALLGACDTQFYERFDIEYALLTAQTDVNHEEIQDFITTMILLNKPLKAVLKLLCIYSLLNGGVEERFFKNVIQNILHVYGYYYYPTITYLVNYYWLTTTKQKAFSYKAASQFFGSNYLVKHAVFNSYAPLSIRLLELILYYHLYQQLARCSAEDRSLQRYCSAMLQSTSQFVSLQKAVKLLPAGPSQTILMVHLKPPQKPKPQLAVLFVIVGGVSQAEITALQILHYYKNGPYKYFGDCFAVTLLSNCTLNGDELLSGFIDEEVEIEGDRALGKEIGSEVANQEITEGRERRRRGKRS